MIQMGLSPRSRGSLWETPRGRPCARSIPALAGKPLPGGGGRGPGEVYPRARGEAVVLAGDVNFGQGLSPRSRGSPADRDGRHRIRWSIPALAGKPTERDGRGALRAVYPRARGEAFTRGEKNEPVKGLSPRSRGSLGGPCRHHRPPAVYPRARGEAFKVNHKWKAQEGLSPRSRGSRHRHRRRRRRPGSIPALAGKPGASLRLPGITAVYPRARGEAGLSSGATPQEAGLSPRSRGSPCGVDADDGLAGSIPALAGKPQPAAAKPAAARVYPRARGEAHCQCDTAAGNTGLSPRSRGSPRKVIPGVYPRARGEAACRATTVGASGSIPALAGKPLVFLDRFILSDNVSTNISYM